MEDYCCKCEKSESDKEKRLVKLKFLRSQLLYDIKNYAYVEADVMGESNQHSQHVTADIGEPGNVDRVSRMLAVEHAAVIEMLYPYTKLEPIEEEIDDNLFAPDVYVVELHVPQSMSRTTMHLLSRLIHEYMVYSVLADWLSITWPDAAEGWAAKAGAVEEQIRVALVSRNGRVRRRLSVFP